MYYTWITPNVSIGELKTFYHTKKSPVKRMFLKYKIDIIYCNIIIKTL